MALAPAALAHSSGRYKQRNLVSDQHGKAELFDSSLVNAWGLAFGPQTPAWVADNGMDVSTLYCAGARPVPSPACGGGLGRGLPSSESVDE